MGRPLSRLPRRERAEFHLTRDRPGFRGQSPGSGSGPSFRSSTLTAGERGPA